MNKNTSILATVVVTLIAVAGAGSWVWWRSHTPKALARELVRSQFKEPHAVRFASLREDQGSKAVCGLLQTRNGAGEFVHKSRFVVLPDGQLLLEPGNNVANHLKKIELVSAEQAQVFVRRNAEFCPEL